MVAFGLLMLELAGYFALVQTWSAITAAAVLAAINFVIAAIILVIAIKWHPGREFELATEVHNSAIDALQIEGTVAAKPVFRIGSASAGGTSPHADPRLSLQSSSEA